MEPVNIERFIKLVTKNELDKKTVRKWYNCVKEHAPSGTITSLNMNNDGQFKSISLIHRLDDKKQHSYIIPLIRDLSDSEIEKIVREFANTQPDLDFDIETQETKLLVNDHAGISLDATKHIALCNALEKQKHENWMKERLDAGWRYGTKFDNDEKTHPLLVPWDQLPDRFKQPDMDWPQKLITLLNDQGYVVIEKNELEKLLNNIV